jgi:hypothetical protein
MATPPSPARQQSTDRRVRAAASTSSVRKALLPESIGARWAVALATIVGGVAAAVPAVNVAAQWRHDRQNGTTATVVESVIAQGSAEADALIRKLFDARGGRILLDAVLAATPGQADGAALNGLKVFYNCRPGADPPGADRCSTAELYWQTNPLPQPVREPPGWHLAGTYTVAVDAGKGQLYQATRVAFAITRVDG